jgi:uncharacterized protein (UPF0335 family)
METINTETAKQLIALIERIERINCDIEGFTADRKEIFAEAVANGFDAKSIRAVIKLRKIDRAKRLEEESILDLYKAAVGLE